MSNTTSVSRWISHRIRRRILCIILILDDVVRSSKVETRPLYRSGQVTCSSCFVRTSRTARKFEHCGARGKTLRSHRKCNTFPKVHRVLDIVHKPRAQLTLLTTCPKGQTRRARRVVGFPRNIVPSLPWGAPKQEKMPISILQ